MAISFYEEAVKVPLKQKLKLKQFLKDTIGKYLPEVKKININYIFCDDAYLLKINQDFLDHDTYTDIITFDLSEYEDELESEIYVSVERIEENAKHFETTFERELHRVIFHGVLHLCGYKDKSPEDEKLMRQKEDECLKAYFQ
jgi:probable rRNA maturation factor